MRTVKQYPRVTSNQRGITEIVFDGMDEIDTCPFSKPLADWDADSVYIIADRGRAEWYVVRGDEAEVTEIEPTSAYRSWLREVMENQ